MPPTLRLAPLAATLAIACNPATPGGAADTSGTTSVGDASTTPGTSGSPDDPTLTGGASVTPPTGADDTTTTTAADPSSTTEPASTTDLTATTTAASSTTSDPGCEPGSEGCACLPGDLCADDLACIDAQCEPPPPDSCGDGILDPGEACDDADADDADGCTAQCKPTAILELSASETTTCVRLSGGAVRCWGGGVPAQLGVPGLDEPIGDDEPPTAIPPIQLGGPGARLTVGADHTCAALAGGDLRCWGYANYGQPGLAHKQLIGDDEHPGDVTPVMIGGPVVDLAATLNHSCAVLASGDVRCWGYYYGGNLGYALPGHVGDDEHPVSRAAVKLGEPAIAVAAGLSHSCALLESKTIRCWGAGASGELGLGVITTIGDDDHPVDFPKPVFTDVEAIDAGYYHTCILRTGGDVHCFGYNVSGQLGYGHTHSIGDDEDPDIGPVSLGGAATKISAGTEASCALLESGDVRCWGYNKWGQLGLGHTMTIGDDELPSDVPVIQLGGKAVDLVTSGDHTCALLEGGGLRCWGYGYIGILGYGDTEDIGDDEHPADVGYVPLF